MRFTTARITYRDDDIVDRRGEEQRVDAIEDAAVAGNQRRAVLHAGAALQHRLEQVAGDAERDDAAPSSRAGSRPRPASAATTTPAIAARQPTPNTKPPIAPSIVFFGLIAGASGRRPNARPV